MPLENLIIEEQGNYHIVEEFSDNKFGAYLVLFNNKPVYNQAKQVRKIVDIEASNQRILQEIDEAKKEEILKSANTTDWLKNGIVESGRYSVIKEQAKQGESKRYFVRVEESYLIGHVRLCSEIGKGNTELQMVSDPELKKKLIELAGGVPGAKRPDKISYPDSHSRR